MDKATIAKIIICYLLIIILKFVFNLRIAPRYKEKKAKQRHSKAKKS